MKAIRIECIDVSTKNSVGLSRLQEPYKLYIDIGKWEMVQSVYESDLLALRDKINEALGLTSIANAFNCTIAEAEQIKQFQKKEEKTCQSCTHKMKACGDCVLLLQSPLERKIFLALKDQKVDCSLQARIHRDGSIHHHTSEIDKSTIRTIPDFLFTAKDGKHVCVYADGHTYHERTEYQALRDRSIDRDVQMFGYTVLRFTGKEINNNIDSVISQIKQAINN
jgi:hypothetical protein